eukprot:scaffold442_cov268-Pinguiococcus_pyrenoidosus.AAC.62
MGVNVREESWRRVEWRRRIVLRRSSRSGSLHRGAPGTCVKPVQAVLAGNAQGPSPRATPHEQAGAWREIDGFCKGTVAGPRTERAFLPRTDTRRCSAGTLFSRRGARSAEACKEFANSVRTEPMVRSVPRPQLAHAQPSRRDDWCGTRPAMFVAPLHATIGRMQQHKAPGRISQNSAPQPLPLHATVTCAVPAQSPSTATPPRWLKSPKEFALKSAAPPAHRTACGLVPNGTDSGPPKGSGHSPCALPTCRRCACGEIEWHVCESREAEQVSCWASKKPGGSGGVAEGTLTELTLWPPAFRCERNAADHEAAERPGRPHRRSEAHRCASGPDFSV